jgi:DNA-binding ferritin-like protein
MSALSPLELDELITEVDGRLNDLAQKGITTGGVPEHWLQELVIQLLDADQLHQARESHYMWLSARLDEAEEQIRRMVLTQGVAMGNGDNRAARRQHR